jgi:protein-S-isoprenylcysteine O-methyltransferase Ste14
MEIESPKHYSTVLSLVGTLRKILAVAGSAIFLVIAPVTVAALVPLRATFGDQYENFCAHVPRWIPRLRPWQHSA